MKQVFLCVVCAVVFGCSDEESDPLVLPNSNFGDVLCGDSDIEPTDSDWVNLADHIVVGEVASVDVISDLRLNVNDHPTASEGECDSRTLERGVKFTLRNINTVKGDLTTEDTVLVGANQTRGWESTPQMVDGVLGWSQDGKGLQIGQRVLVWAVESDHGVLTMKHPLSMVENDDSFTSQDSTVDGCWELPDAVRNGQIADVQQLVDTADAESEFVSNRRAARQMLIEGNPSYFASTCNPKEIPR